MSKKKDRNEEIGVTLAELGALLTVIGIIQGIPTNLPFLNALKVIPWFVTALVGVAVIVVGLVLDAE